MVKDLEGLLALKRAKKDDLEAKKEKLAELNSYFDENKYSIIWGYFNPLNDKTKNKINSYVQMAEALIPQELGGIKLLETDAGKSGIKTLGIVLGRTLIDLFMKKMAKKKAKRKARKKEPKEPD